MSKTLTALALLAVCVPGLALATTWYVDGSIPQSGDGTSWESAFKTVQEAKGAVQERDTIIIAPGTYHRDGTYSPPGLAAPLRGEADEGGDTLLVAMCYTLRGTDPLDPHIVATTVLDGLRIFISGACDETMVVSGLTLRGGKSIYDGGAISGNWNDHSHATIENNIISNNMAEEGGGAIANCDGIIRNNVIKGNWTEGRYGSSGGALYDCDGVIEGNVIVGNWATLTEWTVMSGSAGGALHACDGIIRNNIISGNWAWSWGGGVFECNGTIVNNTIVGNWAGEGAELMWCDGTITNNIVWGNESGPLGYPDFRGSSEPTYCCTDRWTGGGEGNISDDPRFLDAENGDFRLRADSPCIDAGYNDPDLPEFDIAGMPRIMFGGKSLTVDMGAYEFYINQLTPGPEPHQTTFTWSSLADKTYSIFYTDDLFNWHLATANFPSSGNTTTFWTDDGSLTGVPPLLAPRRFYRLLENP
jgi:hypothetical protein